ncbi:MAG: hypothetical protein ACRDOY_12535 [Nocardioidaceae bacterium]
MRFPRRRTPPTAVLRSLSLAPGETVGASVQDRHGRWYVGTTRALVVPDHDGYRRLPWERIERAHWDRDSEQLVVVETTDFGLPEPVHTAELENPGRLLELVRERITASIVVKHFEAVEGKRGITVSARRSPHSDDELSWTVHVDPGLDADSTAVRNAADRGLASAQSEIGL